MHLKLSQTKWGRDTGQTSQVSIVLMKRLIALLSLAFFFSSLSSAEDDGLVLMYNDIEPYLFSENGKLSGFLAPYMTDVVLKANITPIWRNIPWDKQLDILKRNQPNVCSVALFKTPERETYTKYTAPIGADIGFVLVGNKSNPALKKHQSFNEVLNDKNLKPILQLHTVFNPYVDALLAEKKFPRLPGSIPRMMRMLVNNPQSYIIVTPTIGDALIKKNGFSEELTAFSHYRDIKEVSSYYVACSLNTDEVLFARFNQSIIQQGMVKAH
ncbi:MAG: transporter substrate-binding domain-containing protein [Kordiimonas sp.]